MAAIDTLLKLTLSEKASDLHFAAGESPRIRVDGELLRVKQPSVSPTDAQNILFEILTEEECQKFLQNRNLDKSYRIPGIANFRCNFFMTRKGVAAVFRQIPLQMPKFDSMGVPQAIQDLVNVSKGLILITGPTGSGKSTTLAALIDYMNENFNYHILTIEDPVEFIHESKTSLINQREIGNSCPTFADALKYALREDPDVILIGELRDIDTISLALSAAETGHLVLGTLHTQGAAEAVNRIIDSFSSSQQAMIRTMLSESLVAVVSQTLLRRAEGRGRVPAFEIMISNGAISNLIREGKTFQITNVIQTAKRDGMITLDDSITNLYRRGEVSAEEAMRFMENPLLLGSGAQKAIRSNENNSTPNALFEANPTPPVQSSATSIISSKSNSPTENLEEENLSGISVIIEEGRPEDINEDSEPSILTPEMIKLLESELKPRNMDPGRAIDIPLPKVPPAPAAPIVEAAVKKLSMPPPLKKKSA